MTDDLKISKDTIDYVSKLALLDLSEEEKEKLSKELSDILKFFKKLEEVNTTDVKPARHPIEGLKNVFSEDTPRKGLTQEEALKNTKYKKDGFFKAPRILKD